MMNCSDKEIPGERESAILVSVSRLCRLFDALKKGVVFFKNDARIIAVNRIWGEITGSKHDVVKGGDIVSLIREIKWLNSLESLISDIRSGRRKRGNVVVFPDDGRAKKSRLTCSVVRLDSSEKRDLIMILAEYTPINESLEYLEKMFQSMMDASREIMFVKDADGRYVKVNKEFARVFGVAEDELVGKTDRNLFSEADAEKIQSIDRKIRENGTRFDSSYSLCIKGRDMYFHTVKVPFFSHSGRFLGICGYAENVTEKRKLSMIREFEYRILTLLNRPGDMHPVIREVLETLMEMTGIEHIAVRLEDGKDYPYFDYIGFPKEFIQQEKHLCRKKSERKSAVDEEKIPALDCMCGRVIRGEYEKGLPCFTEYGSFWTNDLSKLLSEYGDRFSTKLRGVCIEYGFQSIILIPLRSQKRNLGLLQFCKKQPMMFSPEFIRHLENIASSIAIALDRMISKQKLIQTKILSEIVARAGLKFLETGNIKNLLNMVIEQAVYLTGSKHGMIIDKPDDKSTRVLAVAGLQKDRRGTDKIFFKMFGDEENLLFKFRENLLSVPLVNGRVLMSNDPKSHPKWKGVLPEGHPEICSILLVPVYSEDRISGLIAVGNNPRGYSFHERELLESLAPSAALAINYLHQEKRQKMIEAQLHQAQKMEAIGRLAGGVAHDFNNMLSVIKGYAEMMLMDIHEDSPLKEDIREILKAAKHSEKLTRHLLAFSRSQVITPCIVDLNRVIADAENILNRLIGEEIEFFFIPGVDIWPVLIDPAQVDQILINLVVNACDAIDGSGRITVRTSNVSINKRFCEQHPEATPGDFVRLSVSDTGCGIKDDIREHIFEPFFTTKEKYFGTGLGLSTVYGIVKQNNGIILVSSRVGKGTTFEIYFPRCREKDAVSKRYGDIDLPEKGSGTILLVEDEDAVRKLVKSMLERIGYDVIEAGSPGDACILSERYRGDIHILLTDVVMPVMNGKELSDRISQQRPKIKTIYMSGYPADAVVQHGMMNEGIHFIQKPFKLRELAVMLKKLLTPSR